MLTNDIVSFEQLGPGEESVRVCACGCGDGRWGWRWEDSISSVSGLSFIFSSPSFLVHLSQRLRMRYCDHLPSVQKYLWTTSPLKPLGQFSSNFMWSLLLKRDWKFIQMVTVSLSRWSPCPYMVKTLKNLLQNQESFGAESWYIVSWT